jgi:hypothetical protein
MASLHAVTQRSGRSQEAERFFYASEVLDLLARPQDHLPTVQWGPDLNDAFLASVLSAADDEELDLVVCLQNNRLVLR